MRELTFVVLIQIIPNEIVLTPNLISNIKWLMQTRPKKKLMAKKQQKVLFPCKKMNYATDTTYIQTK